MPTYSTFAYNDGTLYGEPSRIAFSADPVIAVPINYSKVIVSWSVPTGSIQAMRLVRNQEGFPETSEDGVILFEGEGAQGVQAPFVDGEDTAEGTIPLVQGEFAYYRIWLLRVDQNWYPAGDAVTLIPKNHALTTADGTELLNSTYKFLDVLPRAAVSSQGNILDEVDANSAMFKFVSAFSFTLDELYTYADSLLPNVSGETLNPRTLPLQLMDLGMTSEPNLGTKGQKRLVREAKYIYSRKGTPASFGTLIESAVGYAPTVVQSPNILLSMDDSTFVDGLGNWSSSSLTLSRVDNQSIPTEAYSVDNTWVAKLVTSAGGSIKCGSSSPVLSGIPVQAGVEYTFSAYLRKESVGSAAGAVRINWYDKDGALLSSSEEAISSIASTWTKYSVTATSPGKRAQLVTGAITSSEATLETSEAHGFGVGDDVRLFAVPGDYSSFFGIVTVTAVPTSTSFSFETTTSEKVEEPLTGSAVLLSGNENDGFAIVEAKYASIEVDIDNAFTGYMDMVQLASSDTEGYYEPRGVNIHLSPNKVNLVTNPSFASDSGMPDGWTLNNTNVIPLVEESTLALTRSGDHMLGLSGTAGEDFSVSTVTENIETGKFYTFSVYIENEDADTEVTLRLLAETDEDEIAEQVEVLNVLADTWGRHFVSVFVPATSAEVTLTASIEATTDGNHLHLDSSQLEISYATPSDYFDGDYNSIGALWTGDTNASESYFYVNRDIKIERLGAFMSDHLPFKSPYIITIGKTDSPILKLKGVA